MCNHQLRSHLFQPHCGQRALPGQGHLGGVFSMNIKPVIREHRVMIPQRQADAFDEAGGGEPQNELPLPFADPAVDLGRDKVKRFGPHEQGGARA